FVIAGGGPTGVGILRCPAGAPARRASPATTRNCAWKICKSPWCRAAPPCFPAFPRPSQGQAARKLQKLGAQLRFHTHVQGFDGQMVQCQPDPAIPARTLVWTAGVTANPLAATMPGARGPGGRIIVDPHLRLPEYPEVFILGDLACSSNGEFWPQVAPFALQSARHVALVL
ncbi:pyridine nucleotide-disulfide oxidoreductase, partial [Acidithiobacillus sp. GGI-221]